jgi:tetratricopeptide (TPR) repeat protein/DNA-binding winged helix-turn-helix (wHTH) protein/TolB-like protein
MATSGRDELSYVPQAPRAPHPYSFGEFSLDSQTQVLRKNGADIHLRHKTFQLLVYLIDQRHRTVTKQELWDRLWPDSAVTDDALVQCVTDIRRALADDAREPRFIKTIPKLGYRFVGTIEEDLPSVDAEPPVEEAAAATAPQPPQSTPFRRSVPYAFAALFVLAVAGSAALSMRGVPPTRLDPQKTSVMVLYLRNESAAADLDWLRHGLADMLISGLSRSDRLTLLGRQQLDALLARSSGTPAESLTLEAARKLASDMHVEKIVLGTFGRLGGRLRVDVQLYETATGRLVGSDRLVADRQEDVLSEIDLLSVRLAARLGSPEPAGRLVDVMTDNLEAYRHYSLAVDAAHDLRNKEAIAMLQRAVELDPEFAMAHARIGYTYGLSWGLPADAKPHLEKAFSLPNRLTPRDRLNIRAWYAVVNYDYFGAMTIYRQIVAAYPDDVEAYLRLGRLQRGEQQFDEAIATLTKGVAVDPQSAALHNELAATYNDVRKFDRALEHAKRYVDVSRGEANAYDTLGLVYSGMGDYVKARAEFERALAVRPDFEVARVHLANTFARQGRYSAADAEFSRYIETAPSGAERHRGWSCRAWLARQRGRLDEAPHHMRQIEQLGLGPDFEHLLAALAKGDISGATRLRDQLTREGPNRGGRITPRFRLYTLGIFALRTGRGDEAIKLLREALTHPAPIWATDDLETALAAAFLELGRFDDAVAEYTRVIKLTPNYGPAHYGLAEALHRSGRHTEAIAAYRAFLNAWSEADADVPTIRTARQRLGAGTGTLVTSR